MHRREKSQMPIKMTQTPGSDWLQRLSRDRSVTRGFAIVLSLGFLLTAQAHSQLNGPINGADACATLGVNCGHPAGATSSSASYGPLSTFGIVAVPALVGGLGGAFWQNPQGTYFVGGGAAILGGAGFAAIVHRLPTKVDKVLATTAASALIAGGATQAYQFHQAWRNHLDTGYVPPPQTTEVKQIGGVAGGAAAVTAAIAVFSFHQEKLKTSKLQNAPPIVRILASAQISGTPQFMSARFTW
jgi:hypothetical protein